MRRHQAICVGFLSLVCGVFPTAAMGADSTTTATFSPDAVEAGFKLQGSHGYLISVVAYSGGSGEKGMIEFTASQHGESAPIGLQRA
jgi:hypothetical protein